MDKIDEQNFETISGMPIRYTSFGDENNFEIIIENLTYTTNRTRTIRHIFIIFICGILLNIVILQHVVALNIFCLILLATECYALINLVKCGKSTNIYLYIFLFKMRKCLFSARVCLFIYFGSFHCREFAHRRWFQLRIHGTVFLWKEAQIPINRLHP